MRKAIVLLLLLAACSSPYTPPETKPYEPPSFLTLEEDYLYQVTESDGEHFRLATTSPMVLIAILHPTGAIITHEIEWLNIDERSKVIAKYSNCLYYQPNYSPLYMDIRVRGYETFYIFITELSFLEGKWYTLKVGDPWSLPKRVPQRSYN